MKKLSPLLLALILCLTAVFPAAAKAPDQEELSIGDFVFSYEGLQTDYGPQAHGPGALSLLRWVETSSVTHGVNISGGVATSSVLWKTYTSTNKVYLTVTLQKKSGSTWVTADGSWSAEGTGSASLAKTTTVSSGTYRLKTVGSVYDSRGNFIESDTLYSTEKIC